MLLGRRMSSCAPHRTAPHRTAPAKSARPAHGVQQPPKGDRTAAVMNDIHAPAMGEAKRLLSDMPHGIGDHVVSPGPGGGPGSITYSITSGPPGRFITTVVTSSPPFLADQSKNRKRNRPC
jgi:hypothetical protein